MKGWIFKLESVREHKTRLEEQAAAQVAAALRKLGEANAKLQSIRDQIQFSIAIPLRRDFPVHELLQRAEFHQIMRQMLDDALLVVKTAENNLDHARRNWNGARREKEAIEKLRDRLKKQHDLALKSEERKLLDEFGLRGAKPPQL